MMDHRFEYLLDAAPDGVMEIDASGRIVLANPSCERILGFSRAELLSMQVEDLVPMKQRSGHHIHRAAFAAAPSMRPMGKSMRLRALRKDGVEIPVQISISPVEVEGKHHVVAVIRDVSEAEAMAEALRDTAEQTRQLFELTPVACCVYDQETLQFLDVNSQAILTYGYTREEFLTITIQDLRSAGRSGPMEVEDGPRRHVRKNGEEIEVEARRHPMQYQGRSAQLVVLRDITERRRFEERLEEERTRAETASRAKSEFLASMSHELRSPLHTIIGFSELLAEGMEGPLNEKQTRFIRHIQKDSQHLLTLINDILDLSKIEAGRLEFHLEVIALQSLIDETVASVLPQAEAKGLSLKCNVASGLEAWADRVRVHQLLLNLLSNAIKFTPAGGSVLVEASEQDHMVVIRVTDTGIGVPPEHHESIFDVFYQVAATTKGVREGTGLGLAICRRLLEQMGGKIWVESELGNGSKFSFTLPTTATDPSSPRRDRPIVLALEDDSAARELLREYLEVNSYELVFVDSIRETLVKALEIRPDLVLLDLLLPGESGLEALRSLKGLRETREIPVAVVSVMADDSVLKMGAVEYLTKPVAKDKLLAMVRRLAPKAN
ncbi:MAG: PAS domain S-box protein [Acidobacteria bacterium]|nr:PAS domain S-box protein [Acidobacteriota bacterium]